MCNKHMQLQFYLHALLETFRTSACAFNPSLNKQELQQSRCNPPPFQRAGEDMVFRQKVRKLDQTRQQITFNHKFKQSHVPSPILGLANAPIVETKFLELAMSLLDFSPRIPLGTFSILLFTF